VNDETLEQFSLLQSIREAAGDMLEKFEQEPFNLPIEHSELVQRLRGTVGDYEDWWSK
jgi:hypothetical protein